MSSRVTTSLCSLLIAIAILSLFSFGSLNSYGSETYDEDKLAKLDADYETWNINLSEDELPENGNQCVIKTGSVNFLLDPFSKGTVVQTCSIESGSSLFFPFYQGWCDNGNNDIYGEQSYEKLLDCALDSDKGIVTMTAWFDGVKIIDMKINNKDVFNPVVLYDNFPKNEYFKVIKSPDTFNLTVSNSTRFASSVYEKPEDFQSSPAVYKAVAHCFCGLITNITIGSHELRYNTIIEGTGGVAEGKGWDQMTDITYKFNVGKRK